MKSATRALLTTGLVVALGATMAVAAPTAPNAEAFSAANKATVLNYLASIKGQKIVSGQHNKEPASQPNQYTQRVKDITGVYPGLWGGDFLFNSADVANRQRIVDQAKTEWKNGALVSLTWHVCPPTVGSSCSFDDVKSDLTDAQWSQLTTNGTSLNTAWKKRLDEIVPYLQQLKDAGVPAIFRPLHEMNEQWAWWGGAGPEATGPRSSTRSRTTTSRTRRDCRTSSGPGTCRTTLLEASRATTREAATWTW